MDCPLLCSSLYISINTKSDRNRFGIPIPADCQLKHSRCLSAQPAQCRMLRWNRCLFQEMLACPGLQSQASGTLCDPPHQPSVWVLRTPQGDPPASDAFRGRRLWGAGKISSRTFSDTLARSLVASSSEQCSVLVPSMDRMWSPACRAPLLARWEKDKGGW